MARAVRQSVAPAYLLLCLVLGGSAQGIWTNALLQLVGLAIIAWAAASPHDEPTERPARQLAWLFIAGLAVVALQLIPLPPAVWAGAGGRQALADGYAVLGLAIPARPLSLAPYLGLATLLALIPAAAMFCAIARLHAYRRSWLVLALLTGTCGGLLLGALQVSSPDPRTSPWYLYPQSSFGMAAGFFANVNNMAMLMVACLPFLAALAASARGRSARRYTTALVLCGAVAAVLVAGIVLNGSLAGYGLAIPVLVAGALLLIPARTKLRRVIVVIAALGLIGAAAVLATSQVGERALGTSASVQSRAEIMATTVRAAGDFMPFGSGLGTFRGVYQLYENHDGIGARINHAHNDYLELVLELGVAGVLLIAAFLAWWTAAAWRAWRYADAGPYARAASIASAVLLAHSLVEFPLRTAALSGLFALCLALMIERRARRREEPADLRPTRHMVLR